MSIADSKGSAMTHTILRELAQRRQDGLQVTLLWDAHSNVVSVEVVDERDRRRFVLAVASASALDAFYHPYAYAAA
jgi:hypothetical protein